MVALVVCRFREGHDPDGSAPLKLSVNGHCAVSLRRRAWFLRSEPIPPRARPARSWRVPRKPIVPWR
jgi:hypothetical protein